MFIKLALLGVAIAIAAAYIGKISRSQDAAGESFGIIWIIAIVVLFLFGAATL